jgi:cyclic beta-1,2-glucan synthetase
VDIARTLSAERGDGEDADLLAWAEATRAAIASHERVVLALMPWAPPLAAALAPFATAPPEARTAIGVLLSSAPGPAALADHARAAAGELAALRDGRLRTGPAHADALVDATIAALTASAVACQGLVDRLAAVTTRATALFGAMEFGFLFDATRKIFSIGYRITDGTPDPSGYDLLASEARLTSFIAIAKGDVAAAHWFHLGRPMTPVAHGAALLSWSGSMFEYLMPALVMGSPSGSLLSQTYRLVVRRQMAMARSPPGQPRIA